MQKNTNKKLWFKRKTYGFGWTPVTWEGWLVILIYIAVIFMYEYYIHSVEPDGNFLVGVVFPVIIFTSILIAICYKKGEKPKWQWGESTNQVKVGMGAIIMKDGKTLLGKRKGSHGDGEYCSPGGHLDYMESFEDCIRREIREECGIEVKNIQFLYVANVTTYAPKHYINVEISAEWASGEPQTFPNEKIGDWQWYDLNNLPSPMFPFTKQGIDSYQSGKNYYDNVK